jgi:spermidine/putrescine transport system ATP-binding protein
MKSKPERRGQTDRMTGTEIAKERKAAVSVRALSKTFGQGDYAITALDSVEVDILENEFFTLLGPSGCGKTTLLRLIAGFELPTRRRDLLGRARALPTMPPLPAPGQYRVSRATRCFRIISVAENVGFGLRMLGKPTSARSNRRRERDARAGPARGLRPDAQAAPAFGRPAAARGAGPRAWRRRPRCCCSMSRSQRLISSCARTCRWS